MFRLTHISDIHLAPFPAPSVWQLFNKRITGWLNWKHNRQDKMTDIALEVLTADMQKQSLDHIVISGDIVNLALPAEFYQARQWVSDLGNPHNVSIVFGNHDAYVPGSFKEACKIFAPWIRSDKRRGDQGDFFPYIHIRNQVAIIGVSSAIATPPFCACGYFDKKQAEQLASLLEESKKRNLFRIVVIHHPPFHNATPKYKALVGIDRFQKVIATTGAELILHGHTHLPTLTTIPGHSGEVPVVGVASASQDYGGKKPPANYNLFEIEKRNDTWRCRLTRRGLTDVYNHVGEISVQELYD